MLKTFYFNKSEDANKFYDEVKEYPNLKAVYSWMDIINMRFVVEYILNEDN